MQVRFEHMQPKQCLRVGRQHWVCRKENAEGKRKHTGDDCPQNGPTVCSKPQANGWRNGMPGIKASEINVCSKLRAGAPRQGAWARTKRRNTHALLFLWWAHEVRPTKTDKGSARLILSAKLTLTKQTRKHGRGRWTKQRRENSKCECSGKPRFADRAVAHPFPRACSSCLRTAAHLAPDFSAGLLDSGARQEEGALIWLRSVHAVRESGGAGSGRGPQRAARPTCPV